MPVAHIGFRYQPPRDQLVVRVSVLFAVWGGGLQWSASSLVANLHAWGEIEFFQVHDPLSFLGSGCCPYGSYFLCWKSSYRDSG